MMEIREIFSTEAFLDPQYFFNINVINRINQ